MYEDLPFPPTPQDNLPVIDLIARKPVGILHLLDDESNFPKATDHSFLEKCHYNHALNELYSRWVNSDFQAQHSGTITRNITNFLVLYFEIITQLNFLNVS